MNYEKINHNEELLDYWSNFKAKFKGGIIMKIKRIILSTLLGISIVGLGGFAVASKIELDNITDSELIDLVGNRESLGNIKLASTLRINNHDLETTVSKNQTTYKRSIDGYKSSIDKKLTKGTWFSTAAENQKFSVVLVKNQGEILVRYKDKKENLYKDFSINANELCDGSLINSYVKDDLLYVIYKEGVQAQSILKINLMSQKVTGNFILPKKVDLHKVLDRKTVVKNNKLYIPGSIGNVLDGIIILIFDLEKETFEVKEIKPKTIGYSYSTATSLFYDEKYVCYGIFNNDKRELNVLLYNIETEKVNELVMKDEVFKKFSTIFLEDYRINGDKLYLCGKAENKTFKNSIVTVTDLSKGSLDYAGILKYNIRFFSTRNNFQ